MNERVWARVEELVDRAHGLDDLREHRLELIAARRWRALGRPVPPELIDEERFAAMVAMTTPLVLERVRAAAHGPIVVMKGPEVAERYPDPALRPYGDVDILVPDADRVHRALKAAGFEEVGDPALFVGIHHLRPLVLPPFPLLVEVHAEPKWIEELQPPPSAELIAAAVPSCIAVDGISTLRPDHHALVLVAHSWAHEPLRRILELVDVAAIANGLDRSELLQLARDWQIDRVWKTTIAAVDALLNGRGDEQPPAPLRLWARNLPAVRTRTVFESHLERWLAGFWGLPARKALRVAATSAVRAVAPAEDESWHDKFARMLLALRHASTSRAEHDRVLSDRRRTP